MTVNANGYTYRPRSEGGNVHGKLWGLPTLADHAAEDTCAWTLFAVTESGSAHGIHRPADQS